uniref:TNFR-Cys domain-containing protein n=1 Tax=Eptatretus burgeri TaxID=7764 RepID=A0A8C4Q034_EPTBU
MIRLVLGLLFAICLAPDVAEPLNQANPLSSHDTSKEHDSKNCQRCQAGYFQQKTCEIPEGKPTCTPCPNGTFMKYQNNERKCHKCKECSKVVGFEEKISCSSINDRECQCTSQMFQDPDGEICSKCKDCDGRKVEKNCTKNEDTVCSSVRGDEANSDKPHGLGIHPDKTDIGVVLCLCLCLGPILVVVVLLVLIHRWIICKRKKKNSFEIKGKEKEFAEDSRQSNEMTAGKDLPDVLVRKATPSTVEEQRLLE